MAGMKVSIDGMFHGVELCLRKSTDPDAQMYAWSLMEFGDKLRMLRNGECTAEEFFEHWTMKSETDGDMADTVKPENYICNKVCDSEEEAGMDQISCSLP